MDVRVTPTLGAVGSRLQRNDVPAATTAHAGPSDEVRDLLRSTPAKLVTLGVLLAVLLLVSGVAAGQTVTGRKATHDRLLATTEPLADAAQNLYSALSVADAAAATGFISGGIEPKEVRDRYAQAVGEASAQLVAAAGGIPTGDRAGTRLLSGIAERLTVYTGLVETARANNRVGNPVGAAYLGEASNLMQSALLPMAQELYTQSVSAVSSTQRASVQPPWTSIGLLLVTVVALTAVHVIISRISRRTLNPGLLLSIAATGILLCWLLVAGLTSSSATERAIVHGAEPLGVFTDSRILAQQARTAETLQLVRRDATGEYDATFDQSMSRLGELLAGYASGEEVEIVTDPAVRAAEARTAWLASHNRMQAALDRGDFPAAAILATGPGPDEAVAQFATLDRALERGIDLARAELRGNEDRAAQTLSALAPATTALTGLALLGIVVGLWPRLREYR
ncbi:MULTISPECIES: hypothetical protein [unclassified Rhodococcus (in: high G+C Gram-positive bacteria)]|uniref:hypothetical protein n=1 Tax=unclassified Rhodococcus (in: high G+C Gram-positive bacteria) TaxID=192944 RepID=UPI000927BCA9|nr:hypothetical protein [Rhodococcus sp. M8]OLL18588.1 hypothetical protein BKE56_000290 [Rhodococcus sp. M8]QPG47268.1 hypothetical protein ISO16_09890 [Rhodococcus sp. M8]